MTAADSSTAPFLPTRHFLGWDRPLIGALVDTWTSQWTAGVLDLSDRLVVVPTRQAGRRLREALAERAAAVGSGVFPPRVLTTEAMLTELRPAGLPVAAPVESTMVWAVVLSEASLADFPSLFPQAPPRPDRAWALQVARAWQGVRRTLGESGQSMQSAADRLVALGHPEAGRWGDLARLEAQYLQRLRDIGLEDAHVARRQAAIDPVRPVGVDQLDLVAVSDPLELAVVAAGRLGSGGLSVHVWVMAPADRSDWFDPWGVPVPERWAESRDIPLPMDCVHVTAGPSDQAKRVRSLASGHPDPAATLGLAVTDPEVADALVVAGTDDAPAMDDVPATGEQPAAVPAIVFHRPDGEPAGHHELWHVLAGWAHLLRDRSFRALGRWLRYPPVSAELRRRAGLSDAAPSQADILAAWDAYAIAHLPEALTHGQAFADVMVNPLVAAAEAMMRTFENRPLPDALAALLGGLYAGRTFQPSDPSMAAFVSLARELSDSATLAAAAATATGFSATAGELLECVLAPLRESRLELSERPAEAVDINGWLEIAWSDAPHVIIAGFNDGVLPEVIAGDAYLPESLRGSLGLRRTNAARFARDAHQWHAILASRCVAGGRVDVVVGKVSAAGDALRPSRLLFLRPDHELAARVASVFEDKQAIGGVPPPRRHAWRLLPPPPRPVTRLSVTAIQAYLKCPFRFYLQHVAGMREVDADPRELDARAFGSLCHAALRYLTADALMRACDDADQIREFLRDRVRRVVEESYGHQLSMPLRVQRASAERRLSAFAEWQATSVRDGWQTIHAEVTIDELIGSPFLVNGMPIHGRIDRVDARGAERRIIDFKTHDTRRSVAESHLGRSLNPAKAAEWPAWQLHPGEKNRSHAWRDLQLPLYALAARQAWEVVPEVGHFHLTKAVADCGYDPWSTLTLEVLSAAEGCAAAVVEAVRRQEFWPPRETGPFDDFAWMFPGGIEATIDPINLMSE